MGINPTTAAQQGVTWRVTGVDAGYFSIDPTTGVLRMAAQDYENPADANGDNVYLATVHIVDADFNRASRNLRVTVTDVEPRDLAVSTEAEEREPGSTHTSAQELGDITAQRLPGGLRKLEQTVGAEGDAVDYYRFTLSESREVRLGLKLREGEAELSVEDAEGNVLARSMARAGYEAAVRTLLPGTYYVRVEAVGAAASEYEFRYGVLEAYAAFRPASDTPWHTGEAERMGMPSFGEAGYGFELSETADGRVSGVLLGTVLAVDPNEEELSYRIVGGNGSELFALGGASGELSYVGAGEDFEGGAGPYELTVRASDGTHTIDTTVTVTITDAAEAPAFGEEGYAFALAENMDGSVNQISLGVVEATDPESDLVRYSLVGGNDSSLFAIDEASGELSYVGAGEDFESGVTSHELTVRASDGTQTVDTTVTVTIVDAAEAPAFAEESYPFELAENADGSANGESEGDVISPLSGLRNATPAAKFGSILPASESTGEDWVWDVETSEDDGADADDIQVRASDYVPVPGVPDWLMDRHETSFDSGYVPEFLAGTVLGLGKDGDDLHNVTQ